MESVVFFLKNGLRALLSFSILDNLRCIFSACGAVCSCIASRPRFTV